MCGERTGSAAHVRSSSGRRADRSGCRYRPTYRCGHRVAGRAAPGDRPGRSGGSRGPADNRSGAAPAADLSLAPCLPSPSTSVDPARLRYPEHLPVVERRDDILAALRDHQVVVVAGETGSGKTTQLPKMCLELGRGGAGPDRPHPAPADRRALGRGADRRGDAGRARRPRGLPGAVHRPQQRRDAAEGDDRRHPARRDAARPRPAALRHDHHRRGARAVAEHRLHPRLPQAAAAASARPARWSSPRRRSTRCGSRQHFATDERGQVVREVPVIEVSGRTYPVELRYRPARRAAPRRPARRRRARPGDRGRRGRRGAVDRGAPEPGGHRHPGVLLRGARDPRRRRRPERAEAAQHRGAPAVRPALRRRAAPGLPPRERSPDHPGHQRRRDLADRARHRLRRRHRHGPHLALQPAHQGAAPADRAGQPGQRGAARRPVRSRRPRRVHPAVLGGRLRGPPRVHRARDPAHLARLGHPPDDLAGAG